MGYTLSLSGRKRLLARNRTFAVVVVVVHLSSLERRGWVPGSLSAVMEAPFHPRMNRTYVTPEGDAAAARPREQFKVEFDERVFGTRYF